MDRKDFLKASARQTARGAIKAAESVNFIKGKLTGLVSKELAPLRESLSPEQPLPRRAPVAVYRLPRSRQPEELVRPPGALADSRFRKTCTACNACIDACEPGSIFRLVFNEEDISARLKNDEGPFLDVNNAGCRLCEGYPCVQACPTGALDGTELEEALPWFGTATVDIMHCTRILIRENCSACIDECPVEGAIIPAEPPASEQDDSYPIKVDPEGCIGCGLCVSKCPTFPKSITVAPARLK